MTEPYPFNLNGVDFVSLFAFPAAILAIALSWFLYRKRIIVYEVFQELNNSLTDKFIQDFSGVSLFERIAAITNGKSRLAELYIAKFLKMGLISPDSQGKFKVLMQPDPDILNYRELQFLAELSSAPFQLATSVLNFQIKEINATLVRDGVLTNISTEKETLLITSPMAIILILSTIQLFISLALTKPIGLLTLFLFAYAFCFIGAMFYVGNEFSPKPRFLTKEGIEWYNSLKKDIIHVKFALIKNYTKLTDEEFYLGVAFFGIEKIEKEPFQSAHVAMIYTPSIS